MDHCHIDHLVFDIGGEELKTHWKYIHGPGHHFDGTLQPYISERWANFYEATVLPITSVGESAALIFSAIVVGQITAHAIYAQKIER